MQNLKASPRVNELGYQMANEDILRYLGLSNSQPQIEKQTISQIQRQIKAFGDKYQFPPKLLDLPEFNLGLPNVGGDITEHIDAYANQLWGPYKQALIDFVSKGIPEIPPSLVIQKNSGWTRYAKITKEVDDDPFSFDFTAASDDLIDNYDIQTVPHPLEPVMVFDCETFVTAGNTPVMGVAVTNEAWYFWLHPSVINPNITYTHQLISLGTDKLVMGHFVKFDSARVKETYNKSLASPGDTSGKPKANLYLCTQSMHIAVCGMSDKQTDVYTMSQRGSYTPNWVSKTSTNSLVATYNHHVGGMQKLGAADKVVRNIFVQAIHCHEFNAILDTLIEYTLKDGLYTYQLGQALVPKYFVSQPHILTFGGHLMLSQSWLPVPNDWKARLGQIEKSYVKVKKQLKKDLTEIGRKLATQFLKGELTLEEIKNDPWWSQLDWTPAKSGATKGLPLWWRKVRSKGITSKGHLAPVLLRMAWNLGTKENPQYSPLVWYKVHGWIFKCTPDFPASFKLQYGVPALDDKHFGPGVYAKVPHKKGSKYNVGSPLAKDYIGAVDSGLLTSDDPRAIDFLKQAKSIAYWTSMRKRANSYFTQNLYLGDSDMPQGKMVEPSMMAVHGTCSRRCTEALWLTVSGAKPDVIGSELKGTVRPPKGYVMVGADFDAQELKIASAYADAWQHLVHGSSAMGYTQLLGSKKDKTDGHSLLAAFLKLNRPIAKNLNFQMLYLSGLSGCAMTIKSQRPDLEEEECRSLAKKALELRRGKKTKTSGGNFEYIGGTDSNAYNFMLTLANNFTLPEHLGHLKLVDKDPNPRTPTLGSSMSLATQYRFCGNDFLTSRANWGIQSTGVDILHILLTCLEYLKDYFKLAFQFMFTYHDETWVVSPEAEKYISAYCFQIAHLWTWGYFFKRLGFNDLPWGYQWFSGVNIDYCFRKEPSDSQVTPSNPSPKSNPQSLKFADDLIDGEVLNIEQILEVLDQQS
jgi:DNA polymerase gamma 1